MDYEILKPNCVGCEKEIDKPADAEMEAFRFGLPIHKDCVKIYENVSKALKRLGALV